MKRGKLYFFIIGFFFTVFILSQVLFVSGCSQDSDCGSGFIGNSICSGNNIVRNYINSTCINPGTENSSCNYTTYYNLLYQSCSPNQLCSNGVCFDVICFNNSQCNDTKIRTEDICINPGQLDASCSNLAIFCLNNSECGLNRFLYSPFCDNSNVLQFFLSYICNSPGTSNSYCSNSTNVILNKTCTQNQICFNGDCCNVNCSNDFDCNDQNQSTLDMCINYGTCNSVCIHSKINCTNNIDCNDNNIYTEDICLNSGETNSTCNHTLIICITNQDCPDNFFFGSQFCSSDRNISQNISKFTCINPDTVNSYCSNTNSSQVIQICLINQLCSNGNCQIINCSNNLDCIDFNIYTEDKCINPGTLQSYCNYTKIMCWNNGDPNCDDNDFTTKDYCINNGTINSYCNHTKIPCFFDFQCGSNGFFGDQFCQNNNVYKNYTNYTCNNPGSSNSYCTNSSISKIFQTCGNRQTCFNNNCADIICINDSDPNCNDHNESTYDQCINPGTAQSNCTHIPIICFNETKCGIDRWVNNLFCNQNNIFDLYIDYTCNNPGTPNSYCSNTTSVVLNKTCLENQLCYNAQCSNVTCFNDSWCDDKNNYTYDRCNNPEQLNAYCSYCNITCLSDNDCNDNNISTEDHCNVAGVGIESCSNSCSHLPINCTSDTQCGTKQPILAPFCSQNEVFQNYNQPRCINNGTSKSYCGNETIVEKTKSCNSTQYCVDGGICENIICKNNEDCDDKNSYTKDICNNLTYPVTNCSNIPIRCLNNNDCNDGNFSTEDICHNPNETNSYCTNESIFCFDDLKCGTNKYIFPPFCGEGNSVQYHFLTYTCNNPGKAISYCSNTTSVILNKTCTQNQICSNGDCCNVNCFDDSVCEDNNIHTENKCINAGKCNSYCTNLTIICINDTDPNCNDINDHTEDHCVKPNTTDSYCSHINITCLSDSDPKCNDNNINTEDHCISPGKTNSYCTHLPIICFNDSNCGTNFFIGDKFCIENNVSWKYTMYKCNNNGTSNSYCSNTTIDQNLWKCSGNQLCSNGKCMNITCFNDLGCNDNKDHTEDKCIKNGTIDSYCTHINITCLSDNDPNCNDNNVSTQDRCIYPGETNSYCTNLPIICFNNAMCGNDGLIGNMFCSGNNVNRTYRKYTCNLPGTSDSSCSYSDSNMQIFTCNLKQKCSEGICVNINCSNDAHCDDSDDYTTEKCINPGELNAYCNYTKIKCLYDGDTKCDDSNISTEDHCINPNTTISYCSHSTITCFNSSKCGIDGFIGNKFCNGDDVNWIYNTYKCNLPGTKESYCSNSTAIQKLWTCSPLNQICSIGKCVNITCTNDNQCNDLNPYTKDICDNPKTLGASCLHINITCLSDIDIHCNDNNIHTEDHCLSPGLTNSTCIHLPIICIDNLECGIDRFIGNKFCSQNNINWDYISFTCHNKNTSNSYCSNSTASLQIQMCASNQLCTNAICKNVTCTKDVNCSDSNPYTEDKCINPGNITSFCNHTNMSCLYDGDTKCDDSNISTEDHCINPNTTISYCSHSTITCFNSSKCGIDGFIGTKYCNGNDVNWFYNTYKCNLPGTKESYCTNSSNIQKLWTCYSNQLCSNGKCSNVTCFNDSWCDDSEAHTENLCINPGTFSSYCTNTSITCLNDDDPNCNDKNDHTKDVCLKPGKTNSTCEHINIKCLSDSDINCNDNDTYTEDHCLSPGRTNSTCTHLPIICFNSSKCGTDGFIGDKFCSGNDVNWFYKTYTCNIPGTAGSYCTNSTVLQKLWTCNSSQICSLGRCLNVCNNDNQCDDLNKYTKDECINASKINSYCKHTNITCFNYSDCGPNGVVGGQTCNLKDVNNIIINFTCMNPGNITSYCANSNYQVFNQTCGYDCLNGICIPDPNSLKIFNPVNKNYNTLITPINVSTGVIKQDKIEYSIDRNPPIWNPLCSNCNNYGFLSVKTKSFTNGNHSLVFKATKDNYIQYNSTSFFIDTTKPIIHSTLPLSRGHTNGEFNVKYTENNLREITLFFGSDNYTKNDCANGIRKNCTFFVNLSKYSDQDIFYYFIVTDIAGNSVKSRQIKVHVDITPPIINNPDIFWSKDPRNPRYINFNLLINEINAYQALYLDSYDGPGAKWKRLCAGVNNNGCDSKRYFYPGTHNLKIRVIDNAGNYVEKNISFVI